jgi:hypothetical protein
MIMYGEMEGGEKPQGLFKLIVITFAWKQEKTKKTFLKTGSVPLFQREQQSDTQSISCDITSCHCEI